MDSEIRTSALTVTDPRQAAMFSHPVRSRVLLWCAREERTLSQMKARFGLSLSKLHYHVGQLLDAGLLTVARVEPRGGRAVRHYRAVAERFVIPQEHMPAKPSERWAAALRQSLNDAANRGEDLAAHYGAGEDGEMVVRMLPASARLRAPRTRELWRVVPLDAEQRTALAREMAELLDRYAGPAAGPASEPYWVHMAFAPHRSPTGR